MFHYDETQMSHMPSRNMCEIHVSLEKIPGYFWPVWPVAFPQLEIEMEFSSSPANIPQIHMVLFIALNKDDSFFFDKW